MECQVEDEEDEGEDGQVDPQAAERRRLREAEEWRLKQLRSGVSSSDNSNFQVGMAHPVLLDSRLESNSVRGCCYIGVMSCTSELLYASAALQENLVNCRGLCRGRFVFRFLYPFGNCFLVLRVSQRARTLQES